MRIDGKAERRAAARSASHCASGSLVIRDRKLIGEEREAALRGERGIELAHAARRGVARVGEDRQSFALARAVESLEVALAQVDLAARLDERGRVRGVAQRSGIVLIVRRFAVTSSPTRPSPRVPPRTSEPSR